MKKGFTAAWQIKDLFASSAWRFARNGGKLLIFKFCRHIISLICTRKSSLLQKPALGSFLRSPWLHLDGFAPANPSAPSTPAVGLLSQSQVWLSSSFAFTLAEVLITLAIIGVVAALTIPAVVKNYRATELKTQFKKAFSVLNQAVARMNLEEGVIVSKMPAQTFAPIFKKYVKMHKDYAMSGLVYSGHNIDKYKTYAKRLNIVPDFHRWDDGQLILENGMLIMIENPNSGSTLSPTMLSVDLNGMDKPPNVWGEDVFTFQVMESGKLSPMGAQGTVFTDQATYCSRTSTSDVNGIGCAYSAVIDEDYFKKFL